jgi:hypothetical protein
LSNFFQYGANDPTFFSNTFEKSDLDCKIMGCRISRNPAVPGYWFKLRGRIFPAQGLNQTFAMFEINSIGYFHWKVFDWLFVFFQNLTPILIRQSGS